LIDGIRQMAMTATDLHSRGRNFPGHFARREWNIVPVSSVIGVQWAKAPGTALVQKRLDGDSVTIVTGGDAGTHEGDFQTCLVWSTLPRRELPVLMIVMNNGWGISTSCCNVHAEERIIDRGKPVGIPGELVDGNDPIASWHALRRGLAYCRGKRSPYMIEARVSRLHGHSSSSGAARVTGEPDCIELFEQRLQEQGVLDHETIERTHAEARAEAEEALEQAHREARPLPGDELLHSYAASPVDVVYPEDYTGLPR
jgi:2-oxoisovalerate dehydrogenase E1 component alpha subunit